MKKVNIKYIVEHHEAMQVVEPDFFMSDAGNGLMEEVEEIAGYMLEVSKKSRNVVIGKVSEDDFVKAVREMIVITMTKINTDANDFELFPDNETMEVFTHILLFSVLGMLIDEEVL